MRVCILLLVVAAIIGCGDDESDDKGIPIEVSLSNFAQIIDPANPPDDSRLITRFEVKNIVGDRIDSVSLSHPAGTTDTFDINNMFPPDEDGNAFCNNLNTGRAVDICVDFEKVAVSNATWKNKFCTGLFVLCNVAQISCGA